MAVASPPTRTNSTSALMRRSSNWSSCCMAALLHYGSAHVAKIDCVVVGLDALPGRELQVFLDQRQVDSCHRVCFRAQFSLAWKEILKRSGGGGLHAGSMSKCRRRANFVLRLPVVGLFGRVCCLMSQSLFYIVAGHASYSFRVTAVYFLSESKQEG